MERTENQAEPEQEQRKKEVKDYIVGIDLVFGVNKESRPDWAKVIKYKARVVADKWIEKTRGRAIYFNELDVRKAVERLGGEDKVREYLKTFKDEVSEMILGSDDVPSEELIKTRNEARKALFLDEKVKYITFI